MAKFKERSSARELRRSGKSILSIARCLHVSKGTVSVWCRDIQLTQKQIDDLATLHLQSSYVGRMKGAKMNREKKLNIIRQFKTSGKNDVGRLTRRDLFLTGLGLFAGEGFTYSSQTGFSNSDPDIILLILRWFRAVCHVSDDRFFLRVGINQSHRDRIPTVEKYWSDLTKIPLTQFRKTSLKKVQSKKIYENHEKHYGTLAIRVAKSSRLQYQILGWLDALLQRDTIQ